jgi:hypothetical protein
MTPPIRPEIFALCTWGEEEMHVLLLRDVADWYKQVLAQPFVATEMERNYLDKYFYTLCQRLATREGVPLGWLAYSLSQLAQGEVNLMRTVAEEAAGALSLRVPA